MDLKPFPLRLLLKFGLYASAIVLLAAAGPRAEERVYPTPEAVQPLTVGSRVPSTTLQTLQGGTVDLAEVVRKHGALIVFYRGGW